MERDSKYFPKNLKLLKDKELAMLCNYLGPNSGIKCSDEPKDICLAHLADARVFPCSILYRDDTFIGRGLGGCVDWTPIPKERQIDMFNQEVKRGDER